MRRKKSLEDTWWIKQVGESESDIAMLAASLPVEATTLWGSVICIYLRRISLSFR